MRLKAVGLLLLLLLPLLPADAAPTEHAAWWGPTEMLDGWHVRVPVMVKSPSARNLLDATVGHDLDMGRLLIEAGWTSGKQGGRNVLQSFELDELSIRVVEYRSLDTGSPSDGVIVGEVPSRARMGLLESTAPFNNRTSPGVHVEWVMPGVTSAGATRYFMIYADTKANGQKAPAAYDEAAMAPLDARYWISRGTVLHGVAARLTLIGIEDDTTTTIELYQFGKPRKLEMGASSPTPNPLVLDRGQMVELELSVEPVVFRILSDKPVIAGGSSLWSPVSVTPIPTPISGPTPSADGGLLGTEFYLPQQPAMLIAPQRSASVSVGDGAQVQLTPGNPSRAIHPSMDVLSPPLRSTSPIMVFGWPNTTVGKSQAVSPWGGPSGSQLLAHPFTRGTCGGTSAACAPPCTTSTESLRSGELLVFSPAEDAYVRVRDPASGAQRYPALPNGQISPRSASVPQGAGWATATTVSFPCPMVVQATNGTGETPAPGVDLVAFGGGQGDTVTTPVGGLEGATRFAVRWPVSVIAHYNATEVRVVDPGRPTVAHGLGKGDLVEVSVSGQRVAEIVASKPVTVLPRWPGGYFAGIDESLRAEPVGAPQYRGFLVSLEPPEGASEPVVGNAGPGQPVTYKLHVRNLAKDHRGNGVPDTIRLGLSPVGDGWSVGLSKLDFRLGAGESQTVELTVVPPPEAQEGQRMSLVLSASSEGNPSMEDRVTVVTTVRATYGVDLWFDRENGPRSRTLTHDAGERREVTIVLKNLAPIPDRFLVRAQPLTEDWTASFAGGTQRLLEVPLEAGEARELKISVTAPAANASQSLLEVSATSLSSAAAEAKVSATLRIRADVRIALTADEETLEGAPGDQVVFRVKFHNRGTDRVGIRFNTTGALPPGWEPPVTYQGVYAIDELSGLAPGSEVALDVVQKIPANASRGDRARLHFFVETLPQFVGDPVLSEGLDLLALASAHHDLEVLDPTTVVPVGADGKAEIRIRLRNDGNGDETIRLVPRELPRGATILLPAPIALPQGAQGTAAMTVLLPTTLAPGRYPLRVDVTADDGFSFAWHANATVAERHAATLSWLGEPQGVAGVVETARVSISNTGNVPLDLPVPLEVPDGWQYKWDGERRTLAPGETVTALLEMRAPRTASAGEYPLAPEPGWAETTPLRWRLEQVRLGASLVGEGAGSSGVAVEIRNDGTGDATDVEVVLVADGAIVDRTTLHRIPPGAKVMAILAAPSGSGDSAVLRVDNGTRYGDDPLDMQVALASGRDAPGPGVLAVLVLAALAAAWTRRRA